MRNKFIVTNQVPALIPDGAVIAIGASSGRAVAPDLKLMEERLVRPEPFGLDLLARAAQVAHR